MVMHAFKPSTQEAEAGGFLSSEASLVYRASSRTARATQRNPVSKQNQTWVVLRVRWSQCTDAPTSFLNTLNPALSSPHEVSGGQMLFQSIRLGSSHLLFLLLFFLALQRKQNEETRKMDLSGPSTPSIQMAPTWQQRCFVKHKHNVY